MRTQHRTYAALNTRIDILGVEYRYLNFVGAVFCACLLIFGVGAIMCLATVATWGLGAAMYAHDPQWLGVIILRFDPINWSDRYDARRRR